MTQPIEELGRPRLRELDRRIAMGDRLIALATKFIADNRVICSEATVSDRVYENAPDLVEALAEIVGYAKIED